MTTGSRRIELALQGYDAYQAYVRDHPNGLEVNVIDKRAISRINAIPAHDDTVGVANIASISRSHRSRLDHVIEAINRKILQKYLNEWLETQEQYPRFPERIIVKDWEGVNCGSIPKSRVMILPEKEARPVVRHSQGLERISTDHSEGCVIGHVENYIDGEQEVYVIVDMKSYQHMKELLQAERSREIVQAFLGGGFTYEDFLDWIGGEEE